MSKYPIPSPFLDTLAEIEAQRLGEASPVPDAQKDFDVVKNFLIQYRGSQPTFESYRRELERLLQWSWRIREASILSLKREDVEKYVEFCLRPPKSWVGTKRVARFVEKEGKRLPNPAWRPFVASLSKSDLMHGKKPDTAQFKLSQETISAIFIGLGSFYNFLLSENLIEANPVAQIRQKSKYIRKQQSKRKVRRLSELQWDFAIETAEMLAQENPERHERTLFILTALYLMYLRISELVATRRWEPQMGHFYKDSHGNWWFKTVSKGNKERDITVCDEMLLALKRYRKSRNLTPPLPLPNDPTPLIQKHLGSGAVSSDRQIRLIVQECFNRAITRLQESGFNDEAQALESATVHWLRHTGISDDINKRGRPIAHVRDDAGHSSSATTDRYNDIELQARHDSAKNKGTRG